VGECIRCSIGVAPNRYLAKVATDMKKPDGLVFIYHEDLPQKLHSLKLQDLPGIGANMETRLKSYGILDVKILCSLDLDQMRSVWGGIEGEKMWNHLKGIDLPDKETQRRSLGHSQVLAPELRDPEKARIVGRKLTDKAASRLRSMSLVASKMTLSVILEDLRGFELHSACNEVDDSLTFLSLFQDLWNQILKLTGLARIKKISISFSKLEKPIYHQYDFFTDRSQEKRKKISQTLDLIHQKYGKDSATFGMIPESGVSESKIAFTRIPDKEEFF
jgi:DNA polymerase-4